jgi:hypothetical protein
MSKLVRGAGSESGRTAVGAVSEVQSRFSRNDVVLLELAIESGFTDTENF